jgi:hypothetical protein
VRESLDSTLLATDAAELRDTHDFILNLRNKHVAHSVNSFEENSVILNVEDDFQSSAQISSVIPSHSRTAGLSFDEPAALRQLADWWLTRVQGEILAERAKVLALAQSMPLVAIRGFGTLEAHPSDQRRFKVGRRRGGP